MPALKQAWPNSALCWSPATPAMGRLVPSSSGRVSPNRVLEGSTSGIIAAGTRSAASSPLSHWRVCRSSSRVREALLWSVAWTAPPVNCQISQLSMVPNASSPASARARAPGTWSRIQAILVPEK